MPCVILVEETNEIKIVKSDWVQNVNTAGSRTVGTSPNVAAKIFHSHSKKQKANFELELLTEFDWEQNVCFCYHGYVLNICGM